MWNVLVPPPRWEVSSQSRDPPPSRVEVIQRLARQVGFYMVVAKMPATNLRPVTSQIGPSSFIVVVDGTSLLARPLFSR